MIAFSTFQFGQRANKKIALEMDEVEVDAMLANALSIQSGVYKSKDFTDIDYTSDVVNVAGLFPIKVELLEELAEPVDDNDGDYQPENDQDQDSEDDESKSKKKPKAKTSKVSVLKPFKCEKCGRSYTSSTALYNHKEKVCAIKVDAKHKKNEETGKFHCAFPGCPKADIGFNTKQGCDNHWANAHVEKKNKIIPCVLCDRRFATSEAKKAHMARDHQKKFECGYCEKKFLTETHLKKHQLEHKDLVAGPKNVPGISTKKSSSDRSSKSFVCLKCGQAMSHEYGRKHEANCNGQRVRRPEYKVVNEEFFCTVQGCKLGFGFNSMYGLRKHFHDKHVREDEKYFACEYCDQKFSFLTTKNKHVKAVHVKGYICETCGKGFGSKAKKDKHMLTHTGEKPHACDKCDYRAALKYNLDVHKQTKHGDVEQKNYLCTLCNKQFMTMGRVHRHMTVAHGDENDTTGTTEASPGETTAGSPSRMETTSACSTRTRSCTAARSAR